MKKLQIIFLAALLTACVESEQISLTNSGSDCFNTVEVRNGKLNSVFCTDNKDLRLFQEKDLSIQIPGDMFKFENSETETAFSTNPTNDPPKPSDFYVNIYAPANLPCEPGYIGNSKVNKFEKDNEKSIWAKMEMLSTYDRPPSSLCAINAPDCTQRELFEGTCKTKTATYAFCSVKEDKEVAICIQQMTDNQELAKQIFESFRWTD